MYSGFDSNFAAYENSNLGSLLMFFMFDCTHIGLHKKIYENVNMRAQLKSELIIKVRDYYMNYKKSIEKLESIFLAFQTCIMHTKLSQQPKDELWLTFEDSKNMNEFVMYWSLNPITNHGKRMNDNDILLEITKADEKPLLKKRDYIEIDSKNKASYIFEYATYLQDNYPNILRSMNLENILLELMTASHNIVAVQYDPDLTQTSRYTPETNV